MTQLHDPRFISFDGTPITGRVPASMLVMNDVQITPEQHGGVMHAYKLFRDCLTSGIVPYLVQHRTLTDGTAIRMESMQGQDRVMVWPVGRPSEENDQVHLWVLITVDSTSAYVEGSTQTTTTKSKLLKLATRPETVANAKLIYSGETTTMVGNLIASSYHAVGTYVYTWTGIPAHYSGIPIFTETTYTETVSRNGQLYQDFVSPLGASNQFGAVDGVVVFRGVPILHRVTRTREVINLPLPASSSSTYITPDHTFPEMGTDRVPDVTVNETQSWAGTHATDGPTNINLSLRWPGKSGWHEAHHTLGDEIVPTNDAAAHIRYTPYQRYASFSAPIVLSAQGASYSVSAPSGTVENLLIGTKADTSYPATDANHIAPVITLTHQSAKYAPRELARALSFGRNFIVSKLQEESYLEGRSEPTYLRTRDGTLLSKMPAFPSYGISKSEYLASAVTIGVGETPKMKLEVFHYPTGQSQAEITDPQILARVIPTGRVIDFTQHPDISGDADFVLALSQELALGSNVAGARGSFIGASVQSGGGSVQARITVVADHSAEITSL